MISFTSGGIKFYYEIAQHFVYPCAFGGQGTWFHNLTIMKSTDVYTFTYNPPPLQLYQQFAGIVSCEHVPMQGITVP